MHCPNCGKPIKDSSKYCQYCGSAIAESVIKENHTKKNRPTIYILLAVALCAVLGAAVYWTLIRGNRLADLDGSAGAFQVDEDKINANTTVYDDGDWVYSPPEEDICVDEETGISYYNNILEVYLKSDASDDEIEALEQCVNGVVVGKISGCINAIQIMVEETDLDTLNSYAEQLMEYDQVSYASYEFPTYIEESSKLWDGEKDLGNEDSPSGADWWAEAIGAYTAWKFEDLMTSEVTIGIMDSGFDLDHEDLVDDNGTPVLNMLNTNTESEHGTHVAGIMAAQENEFGIRGIANKAKFYCVDLRQNEESEYFDVDSFAIANYIKDMVEQGISNGTPVVVNNSWGTSISYPETSEKERSILSTKKGSTRRAIAIITSLLDNGHEQFVFVESAGNGYSDTGTGYDTALSGWFCGIDEDFCESIGTEYSYEEIKSHVMIVGAVENTLTDGMYQLTEYSNYGENVDICAPGGCSIQGNSGKVYSTVCDSKYGYLSGTSMAAPMVTASAALIWSYNPDLSAAEVKQILLETAGSAVGVTGEDKGVIYPMLNVGDAVVRTIGTGSVTGTVVDAETGEVISGVTCTLDSAYMTIYPMMTSLEDGTFSLDAIGTCKITVEKEGYITKEIEVTLGIGESVDIGHVELEKDERFISADEETYLRTVLSAVGGEEFFTVSNLTAETIASILLAMPDVSYVSYNTADYIPYTTTGNGSVLISNEDLSVASSAIFGHSITSSQLSAMENFAGYEINASGCMRDAYNGRGGYNEVIIDTMQSSEEILTVSYRYITYDTAEASQSRTPSTQISYVASFVRNDSGSRYPFRITSNLRQDNTTTQNQFDVLNAYRQLIQWGLSQNGSIASLSWCSMLQQDPYELSEYFTPDMIWAYYVVDLDHDGTPELILNSGEEDTGLFILNYNGANEFSVSLVEGQTLLMKDNAYYALTVFGDYSDDPYYHDLYQIDSDTLQGTPIRDIVDERYDSVPETRIGNSLNEILVVIETFY